MRDDRKAKVVGLLALTALSLGVVGSIAAEPVTSTPSARVNSGQTGGDPYRNWANSASPNVAEPERK